MEVIHWIGGFPGVDHCMASVSCLACEVCSKASPFQLWKRQHMSITTHTHHNPPEAAKCQAGEWGALKPSPLCGPGESCKNLWFSPSGAFYSLFVCLGVSLTSNAWSEALVVNQEAFLSLWLSSQKRETCKKIIKGISELVERATLKSSGLAFALCPRERERKRAGEGESWRLPRPIPYPSPCLD